MASWFDSSSFTGFLSQAQKSIDKVLDIPTSTSEGKSQEKKIEHNDQPTTTETRSSRDQSQDQVKNGDDTKVSNSSWLSGQDSFWGSFVNTPKEEDKKKELPKEKDTKEEGKKIETRRKPKQQQRITKPTAKGGSEVSKKSLLSSQKSESSKRGNSKLQLKKNKPAGVTKKDVDKIVMAQSVPSNKPENGEEILKDNKENDPEYFAKGKQHSLGEADKTEEYSSVEMAAVKSDIVKMESVEDCLKMPDSDVPDGLVKDNEVPQKVTEDSSGSLVGSVVDKEHEKKEISAVPHENVLSKGSATQNNVDPSSTKEKNVEDKDPRTTDIEVDLVEDSFYSTPVASSTPCNVRTKKTLTDVDDLNDSIGIFSNHELLAEIKTSEEDKPVTSDALKAKSVEKHTQAKEENLNNVSEVNDKQTTDGEALKQESERLLQIIEVRESKLVALSKENLDLQETNTILRSQLEQLEEVNKTDDAEFNEMKEEFTNRISNAESKLQTAAKERDLYKQQLEETQQCLSSDMERQLKEFQQLSQQKDQQIVDLMEEGQKLSKEVLQRSNNMKKLRAREKEMSEENEKQKTRLEAAESELERLTEILKERDEHKKEQDDAINKLNAYIQKQDEQLAKQKVELEESSSKLPSLQTALDNAYKEITELNKVNAAKSNAVQEATLSVEMNAKEELRIAMEKLKKASQKDCDVLALEVTDLQLQLSRSEQQAARREDNLRQEIADVHTRLQEAETRNQELSQSVSVATRPLLRQIENLQHSYGSQQTSWEKLEKNLTDRLADAQSQQAVSQEKERVATEKYRELSSRVTTLDSQVSNYRHEKSRLEAELEIERTRLEALEEFKSRETGKIEALKSTHAKQLKTVIVEKSLLEQQLVVERTKCESVQKKCSNMEDQLREQPQKQVDISLSKNNYENEDEDDVFIRSRNTSMSSQISLSDNINRGIANGSTAVLEDLRATIRHKEGELSSMQSAIATLEAGRESLTKELTSLVLTNENLLEENKKLSRLGESFQDLQTKYNALLQMYGEKQEETEELKLDLQDIKMMYKAQIQELLSGR